MKLAIIGAGVAGLVAARLLRQRDSSLEITVYEKSRGLGGRVATRRREGFTFDHGAQYLKTPTPALTQLVTEALPNDQLHDIGLPVWTFNQYGTIAEGDPEQNADPKWTYRDGVNRLGKLLAEGTTVQRSVRIASLQRGEGGAWTLTDTEGHHVGNADAVLFTPPAPQIVDLLVASAAEAALPALLDELRKVRYRRCISFALAYNRRIERPFYALVNTDREHAISWLALEHLKNPERAPAGHSLLLPQMTGQWSLDHWETPTEELAPVVAALVAKLLGEDLGAPLWVDAQRWRYALPDAGADFTVVNDLGAPHGLFFAGDYAAGQGRVYAAIESGERVAEVIAGKLV